MKADWFAWASFHSSSSLGYANKGPNPKPKTLALKPETIALKAKALHPPYTLNPKTPSPKATDLKLPMKVREPEVLEILKTVRAKGQADCHLGCDLGFGFWGLWWGSEIHGARSENWDLVSGLGPRIFGFRVQGWGFGI